MIAVDSEKDTRTLGVLKKKRGRKEICGCGCKTPVTHSGLAGGYGMCTGCEFSMRLWVKQGYKGLFRLRRGRR
jgi:hypothetical protein